MVSKSLVLVLLVGISAAIATSAFGQRATVPTLKGTDGPGFSITLKQNGKLVKTLKAGTYRFVIADKPSTTPSISTARTTSPRTSRRFRSSARRP